MQLTWPLTEPHTDEGFPTLFPPVQSTRNVSKIEKKRGKRGEKGGKGGKAEAKLWDGDEVRHDNDQDGQDQEAIL